MFDVKTKMTTTSKDCSDDASDTQGWKNYYDFFASQDFTAFLSTTDCGVISNSFQVQCDLFHARKSYRS